MGEGIEHEKGLAEWCEWMPINGVKCSHTQFTEEELLWAVTKGRNEAPNLDARTANEMLKMPKEWWRAVATHWNEVIKTDERAAGLVEKPVFLHPEGYCNFKPMALAHLRSFMLLSALIRKRLRGPSLDTVHWQIAAAHTGQEPDDHLVVIS